MFKCRVARRDKQTEYVDCYTVDELDNVPFKPIECVRTHGGFGKKSVKYNSMYGCFDTETAHNHDEVNPIAWIYQWAWFYDNIAVVGRTPSDFIELLEYISNGNDFTTVIYVHNLSYDFEYIRDFLYQFDNDMSILAINTHKPITVKLNTKNIEFRCSYRLSNMSLAGWCDKYKTEHVKAVGEIDYDEIFFQDSELLENNWFYMISDVVSMRDCLEKEMQGFNIATVPITSTGFVRDDMRKSFKADENARKEFAKTRLSFETYSMLKNAFAGGLTHGNRFYTAKTVCGKIGHYDFRSFYPSVIATQQFPIGAFSLYYDVTKDNHTMSLTELLGLKETHCIIMLLEFENLDILSHVTLPYLQIDKVVKQNMFNDNYKIKYRDNGRALRVDGRFFFTCTELDLEIIMSQYHCEKVYIDKVYISKKGKLPKWFQENNNKYFHAKLNLKGVDDDLYMKSKNKLNAQYGMSATDPVHNDITLDYNSGIWSVDDKHKNRDMIDDLLNKFYKSHNSFMRYQFGVWVTAYCRNMLVKMCELVGYENFLYCDTDSIFFIDNETNSVRLKEWNENNYNERVKNGEYIINEKTNEPYEYLAFEDEHDGITAFRFLHAKCYAFNGKDGLSVTIAGVPKVGRVCPYSKTGERCTREKELHCINQLDDNFVFHHCGGSRIAYNQSNIKYVNINGHNIECASSGIILDKDYIVGGLNEDFYIGFQYE